MKKDIKDIYQLYKENAESAPPINETKEYKIKKLQDMGYDVKEWNLPGYGDNLQITFINEKGRLKGITTYVKTQLPLSDILAAIEVKKTKILSSFE